MSEEQLQEESRGRGGKRERLQDVPKSSTKFINEFRQESRDIHSGRIIKPENEFGKMDLALIGECIEVQYGKYRKKMPNVVPDSVDECVDQFFAERSHLLKKVMRNYQQTKTDRDFINYLNKNVKSWYLSLYGRTPEGKLEDAIRTRLARTRKNATESNPSPFVPAGESRWGLTEWVRAGAKASDLPWSEARDAELFQVADRYPFDMDTAALLKNANRSPNLGKTGQLETMLYGVLKAARGSLSLGTMRRVLEHRVPALTAARIESMDARPASGDGYDDIPREYVAGGMSLEDQVLDSIDNPNRTENINDMTDLLMGMSPSRRKRYIEQHPGIFDMLTSININVNIRKA